jgi:hypothetical protein
MKIAAPQEEGRLNLSRSAKFHEIDIKLAGQA